MTLWNKEYCDPAYFLGFVRIPISSTNLLEGGFSRWYPLDILGKYISTSSLLGIL